MQERTYGMLFRTKFHTYRFTVSSLSGKPPNLTVFSDSTFNMMPPASGAEIDERECTTTNLLMSNDVKTAFQNY